MFYKHTLMRAKEKTSLMTRVQSVVGSFLCSLICSFVRTYVHIGCVSIRIRDNPILSANKLLPSTRKKSSAEKNKEKTSVSICCVCVCKPLEKVNKMCPRCSPPMVSTLSYWCCILLLYKSRLLLFIHRQVSWRDFMMNFLPIHFSVEKQQHQTHIVFSRSFQLIGEEFSTKFFGLSQTIVSDIEPITLLV